MKCQYAKTFFARILRWLSGLWLGPNTYAQPRHTNNQKRHTVLGGFCSPCKGGLIHPLASRRLLSRLRDFLSKSWKIVHRNGKGQLNYLHITGNCTNSNPLNGLIAFRNAFSLLSYCSFVSRFRISRFPFTGINTRSLSPSSSLSQEVSFSVRLSISVSIQVTVCVYTVQCIHYMLSDANRHGEVSFC